MIPVTSFIYGLVCPLTKGIRYVGMSYRVKDRLFDHLYNAEHGEDTHKSRWIKILLKQGLKPRLIILDVVLNEYRGEREKEWIRILKESGADLTNSSEGGIGNLGWKHTEKTKEIIRARSAGFRHTEESIEKMRRVKKGHPVDQKTRDAVSRANKGRILTQEQKDAISKRMKGRVFKDEWKKKISDAKKGVPCPEWQKEHLRILNTGKRHSIESRAKMSVSQKGRIFSEEHRKNLSLAQKGKSKNYSPERIIQMRGLARNQWTGTKQSEATKYKRSVTFAHISALKEDLIRNLSKGGN